MLEAENTRDGVSECDSKLENNAATEDDEDEEEDEEKEDEMDDSDDTESESSDSMDEAEAEERRAQYLTDMGELENQFSDLKEQLYKERIEQIEKQLEQVTHNEANEYTGPLKRLEDNHHIRIDVCTNLKKYRTINLENSFNCELQLINQQYENHVNMIREEILQDLDYKLRKVEEDRHTLDTFSDLWSDDSARKRRKRKSFEMFVPEKRKKPINVTGPFMIYMLKEFEVLEDITMLRKAKNDLARRKTQELFNKDGVKTQARYEDGKFFYDGHWFQKGEKVQLDNKMDNPVNATITAINTGEVWVSKGNGLKCKLFIAQFQQGKFIMRKHRPKMDMMH